MVFFFFNIARLGTTHSYEVKYIYIQSFTLDLLPLSSTLQFYPQYDCVKLQLREGFFFALNLRVLFKE